MTPSDVPPWERLEVTRDFRERLCELSSSGDRRLFHPLDTGAYVVSIQASAEHASLPRAAAPPGDVAAWEVAVFTRDGRLLDERWDAELASLPAEWRHYWGAGIGRLVPTPVLQVVLHRFALGPEDFDHFILGEPG
ncbi:MAG: hypothetical protein JWM27_4890 [Gemmatimonadetes bacterium]|nr:hypothetical protein [Gemmatimonadota bacterium]